ncbi:MAG: hypothetical protein ACYC0V_10130 [Armatimonadota bacterium]
MKVICVGGVSSNCGKTSLVLLLSKVFPDWAVVKVTPSRPGEVCPNERDCGACTPPESGSFEIVTDIDALAAPGKDTARYLEAGVSRVMWIRVLPEYIPSALETGFAELSDAPGVILESTSSIRHLDGLRILTVRDSLTRIKASALEAVSHVDIVVVNTPPDGSVSGSIIEGISRLTFGESARVIPMCAVLPPDAPENQAFIEACRNTVNTIRG